MLTEDATSFGLLMLAPFLVGAAAGSVIFAFMSDAAYRGAAYVIILFAALTSLPLFDRFFR